MLSRKLMLPWLLGQRIVLIEFYSCLVCSTYNLSFNKNNSETPIKHSIWITNPAPNLANKQATKINHSGSLKIPMMTDSLTVKRLMLWWRASQSITSIGIVHQLSIIIRCILIRHKSTVLTIAIQLSTTIFS